MARAKAAGGPTVHTRQTMPDWDGWYARDPQDADSQWIWGTINQVSTILSVLTPEYQKRMVQMNYHEGVNNSPQWNASFCYPEGYHALVGAGLRRREFPADRDRRTRSSCCPASPPTSCARS